MSAPMWASALVRRAAGVERAEEAVGDLDEVHNNRVDKHGRAVAGILTTLEAIDVAVALRRVRTANSAMAQTPSAIGRQKRLRLSGPSLLDFKLGFRMLVRYPWLTIIGGLAMALGIALGSTVFHMVTELIFPDHPYTEVNRIVGIQNVDVRTTRTEWRALGDFARWRTQLQTVDNLGARRSGYWTSLDSGDGMPTPVAPIAITASAFVLAPVPPHLGRPLFPSDEDPIALRVAVLSFELWETRFQSNPEVVGDVIRLGGVTTTIVGVMPPRFALHIPSNDLIYPGRQDLWLPLRLDPLAYTTGEGPRITVFGRLAPGVSTREAEVELAAVGVNQATETPETHAYMAPELRTFANPFGRGRGLGVQSVTTLAGFFIVIVMVILCANVALLLFARAETREGELVVRSALGASRGRIVSQLFAEALALAAVALVLGLYAASFSIDWIINAALAIGTAEDVAQPWMSDSLSSRTILYSGILAVAGAAVAGVIPRGLVSG